MTAADGSNTWTSPATQRTGRSRERVNQLAYELPLLPPTSLPLLPSPPISLSLLFFQVGENKQTFKEEFTHQKALNRSKNLLTNIYLSDFYYEEIGAQMNQAFD